MMKLASVSAGYFSHRSILAVMKQIQSESKMIPSSRIAERDSRYRRGLIWFIWLVSFTQTNKTNQTNQISVFLCWQTFSASC